MNISPGDFGRFECFSIMAKDHLFPEDPVVSTDPILALIQVPTQSKPSKPSPISAHNAVGDHIHELLDRHLQKLVFVKYENDPNRLIRQLSRDLAAKETELILLRRKSSQREHELSRLCTEFGNLSSLELDQKLAALKPDQDLHKVLSHMVGSAVEESGMDIKETPGNPKKNNTAIRSKSADVKQPHRSDRNSKNTKPLHSSDAKSATTSSSTLNPPIKDPLLQGSRKNLVIYENGISSRSRNNSRSTNQSSFSSLNKRNSQWLQWLKPPKSSESGNTDSVEISKGNEPVELKKINHSMDEAEAKITTDCQTDRFGFYNNPSALREATKALKVEDGVEENSENRSPSQNSSTSSELSFTEIMVPRPQSVSSEISKISTVQGRFSQSMEKLKRLGQQHDVVNQQLLTRWDALMSNVQRYHSKDKTQAEDVHELFGVKASKLRWSDHGFSWFFSTTEGDGKTESRFYKELLLLVNEEGIPPRYRNLLWLELSGASNKAVPGEFQRLLSFCHESTDPIIKKNVEQINLDLHRTLSSNKFFFNVETCQPGPHYHKLQNILYAFVAYNLEVGYSQGMNRIVGNLILGISDASGHGSIGLGAEDIFWIFVGLLEELLPKYKHLLFYHQNSLPLIQKDVSITSNYYIQKLLPELHQHLMAQHVEIEIIILGWWLGLFTEGVNSLDLWFNVVDGLMLAGDPGVKLITYSIATLKVFERNLLDLDSADEIYNFFQRLKVGSVANIRIIDFVSTCSNIEKHITLSEPSDLRAKRL